MKKIFLLFVSVTTSLLIQAQVLAFDYTFTAPTTSYALFQTKCLNGDYVTLGTISLSSDYFYLIRTDVSGNLIWSNVIQDTALFRVNPDAMIETNDGGFCITGFYRNQQQNTANNEGTVILRLDSAGNILWQEKLYIDGLRFYCKAIEEDSAGYLYLGYERQTTPQGMPAKSNVLLKLTPSGLPVWAKESTETGFVLKKMQLLQNNTVALGNSTINMPGAKIVVVDTSGNVLSSTFYLTDTTTANEFTDFTFHNNGSLYALLQCDSGNKTALYVYDSTANFLNGNVIDSLVPVGLKNENGQLFALAYNPVADKTIVTDWSSNSTNAIEIAAGTAFEPKDFYRNTDGSITCYGKTPSGSIFAQRLIKTLPAITPLPVSGCSVNSASLSFQPISIDDSTVFETFIPTNFNVAAVSFVTTPLNLTMTSNCLIIGLTETESVEQIAVYPNPAVELITFNKPIFPGSVFTLCDASGNIKLCKKVQHSSEIAIGQLPDGIYFWQLNQNGRINSGKLIITSQ
jgi:hypothetical protein